MGTIEPDIAWYYDRGNERGRLGERGTGRLEFLRTQILLRAVLPPPPARVLDVGGGPGIHACWLAREGYDVVLVDPMPLHVEQASEVAAAQPDASFHAELGDARELRSPDASVDAVLLLGPLYHLPDRADRALALSEAVRVLRPDGLLAAAVISRFASTMDGIVRDFMVDAQFREIALSDLQTGVHHNPARTPGYFTTAYFHHPDDLRSELLAAALEDVEIRAIEGFGGLFGDLDERLDDAPRADALLHALAHVDDEPSLLGVSFHLLGLGRKP